MESLKVIVHAPTPSALERAISNVRNLLVLEPNADVELVVNGPAIAAAVDINEAEFLSRLVLCRNSLEKQNLQAQPNVSVVRAAVLHLAYRQQNGWTYIRA